MNSSAGIHHKAFKISHPQLREAEPLVRHALIQAARALLPVSEDLARLDAEVLLAHILGITRAQLFTRLSEILPARAIPPFESLVERRLAYEPIPYLVGHKAFYGLDLVVNRAVLIPRPETELLVERALSHIDALAASRSQVWVSDVGTGSGAIAIALAVYRPHIRVIATDISPEALEIADANARRQGVGGRITFLAGNLLAPLPHPVDLVCANLPYIPREQIRSLMADVRDFEPNQALDGGAAGLQIIEALLRQIEPKLRPGGILLLEIGDEQGVAVTDLARSILTPASLTMLQDMNGCDRVVDIAMRLEK
ncbi:MAG: peptide chain release factor N(5)-glutamine methyltransferase [Chloroflexi bacterium]|nr:peptide chain release factor N(5)-glutamine methyltransferase [Chloroflexota bacterium]